MVIRLLFVAVFIVASILGFKAWSVHKAFSVLQEAPLNNALGPDDADITLVEIVDYRCSACRAVHPVLKEFHEKHPDVRIVFRHFLVFEEPSLKAAQLALAAGMQGQFEIVHNQLMGREKPVTDEYVQETASNLGLDMEKFNQDLKGPEIGRFLLDNIDSAERLGLNSTPTFIVGNTIMKLEDGMPTVEIFEKMIAVKK